MPDDLAEQLRRWVDEAGPPVGVAEAWARAGAHPEVRAPRRRPAPVVVALTTLVAAAVLVAVVVAWPQPTSRVATTPTSPPTTSSTPTTSAPTPTSPPTTVVPPPPTPAVPAVVRRLDHPAGWDRVDAAAGWLWATTFDRTTLEQVDPATLTVVRSIERGERTWAVTADAEGAVWACGPATTHRLDPASGAVTATVAEGCDSGLAFGFGSVWLTRPGAVVRIDPTTATVTAQIEVAGGGWGIATGAGRVWVSDGRPGAGSVVVIDPGRDAVVAEVAAPARTRAVEVAGGMVWTVAEDGGLWRLDPVTLALARVATVHGDPHDVVVVGRFAWVTGFSDVVTVVDVATGEVVSVDDVRTDGVATHSLAATPGRLWVSVPPSGGGLLEVDPTPYAPASPEAGLDAVVGSLLAADGTPAPAVTAHTSTGPGPRRYDEVRLDDGDGRTLVVAVSDEWPDAVTNLEAFNTELGAFDDGARAWLGADTDVARAVTVTWGTRVVYVRSEGPAAPHRGVPALRELAHRVLRAWAPPQPGPGGGPARLDLRDLSGDGGLRIRAVVVVRDGARFLEVTPEAPPPPGAEIWALYVNGSLRGRSGPATTVTGTRVVPLSEEQTGELEVVLAAQTWAGTTLAASPPVPVSV